MVESKKDIRLKEKSLAELQQIVLKDYSVVLTQEEADQFGFSLLKITKLAIGAFNRTEDIAVSA